MPSARFRRFRPALLALLVATAATTAQQPAPPPTVKTPAPSSTSATGQFTIHGSDLATRSAFCLLCDDVAAALGRLLRDDAHYSLPVVIVLKSPPDATLTGPAVTWNISQLAHGGFHLQINATLRAEFKADDFAREVVRILIAERILRSHKELKTSRQNVLPNWVLTGVTQALEFRGRSRPSVLFAAVFRNGQIYGVDKILAADPGQLDALARGVYETSACALVLALLDQPDGPVRFGKFLEALARNDKSDRELLRQMFPTLGASKNSLEKWWALQMATLATPSPLESLGVDETEARLRAALMLVFDPAPEKESRKKSAPTPPEKKGEGPEASKAAEGKKDGERRSFFRRSSPEAPIIGGKKILFMAVSDANTDGASPKKASAKPDPKEAVKSAEKSKTAANETPKKTAPAAGNSKDDKTEAVKRNPFDPRTWFRGKDKPPEETPKKESAATKDRPAENRKSRETPAESNPSGPAAGVPLEEFATVWKRDDRDKIFQRTIGQLSALKVRAHPLYRPLIEEYIATVRLLVGGKPKGVPEKLATLREQQTKVRELARAVETHLDWYEAEQTRSYSGLFDDYLKLGDKIEQELRPRNDALSKYLDTLAKEYGN
jgi:hypothetical protein